MAGAAKALADQTAISWRLAKSRLADLTDDEFFWEPVGQCWVPAWGGQVARRFLVSHVTAEVLHHSAEVGRLRDLYRNRQSLALG